MQIDEHSSLILTQNPGTDKEIRIIAKVLPEVVVRYTELMNQIMNPEDYDNQIELLKRATWEITEKISSMEKEQKPDWITDEQWKGVPSIAWWENNKKIGESLARQKPSTVQEAQAQFLRLRNSKNWSEGV